MKERFLFSLCLVTVFIHLCGLSLAAQPFCRVHTFDIHDGLPANNISRITQDNNDLIWVSTWNGLCYFDGYRFSSFRSNDKNGLLTSNHIIEVKPDSCGHVWLLTYDHIPYYLDTRTGTYVGLTDILRERTGKAYTGQTLANTGTRTWLLGKGKLPSVRFSNTDPSNHDSITVVDESHQGAWRTRGVAADNFNNEWLFSNAGIRLYGSTLQLEGDFMHPVSLNGLTYLTDSRGNFYSFRKGDARALRLPRAPRVSKVTCMKPIDETRLAFGTDNGVLIYDTRRRAWS